MNLFEDDNKNEAAPAQEPVSAKPAEKPKPTVADLSLDAMAS